MVALGGGRFLMSEVPLYQPTHVLPYTPIKVACDPQLRSPATQRATNGLFVEFWPPFIQLIFVHYARWYKTLGRSQIRASSLHVEPPHVPNALPTVVPRDYRYAAVATEIIRYSLMLPNCGDSCRCWGENVNVDCFYHDWRPTSMHPFCLAADQVFGHFDPNDYSS